LASIDHTAYPRFKRVVSGRELSEVFSPTQDELAWARERTQNDRHLLALVVGLKSYQRLGYFPRLADVPAAVIDHGRLLVAVEDGQIAGCIGLRPCGDGAWVLDNFAVSPSRHGRVQEAGWSRPPSTLRAVMSIGDLHRDDTHRWVVQTSRVRGYHEGSGRRRLGCDPGPVEAVPALRALVLADLSRGDAVSRSSGVGDA
jgi:hypothetical protein